MTNPETDAVGVGIAGLGMAGGVMLPVIAAHPRLRLAAAADIQPDLRQRFEDAQGLPAHASFDELVGRDDIEAIYIATPHQLHADQVVLAARHGKHVVVEKPMAMTLAQCDAMIAAAVEAGTTIIVGHTHAFDPVVTAIRALIAEGGVGRPLHIHNFNYTNFIYRPRRPDELDPAQGGGIVWNQLPHQIDIARAIVDAPLTAVRASLWTADRGRMVDGLASVFAHFDGGAAATLVYSGYDRFDSDEWFDWIGASGNAKQPAHGAAARALDPARELADRQERWSYGGAAMAQPAFAGQPHFGQLIVTCEHADIRTAPHGLIVYDRDGSREIALPAAPARPSHVAVWDELIGVVRDGRAAVHDGAFARRTVQACLAIAESARLGREIAIDPPSRLGVAA